MVDAAVDAALDELYGGDPSEFVAVRKRLSATLRAAGDKDGAKALLAARRPSTSAWALNQVARLQPDVIESLLDASSALFAAQTRGSNKPDALRNAIRAHREAVDIATEAALGVLGGRANDTFRSEIVSTLRAVSTDEDAGRQLRSGRVVREASASGFPDSGGLTLVPDLPATTPKTKAQAAKPTPKTSPKTSPKKMNEPTRPRTSIAPNANGKRKNARTASRSKPRATTPRRQKPTPNAHKRASTS